MIVYLAGPIFGCAESACRDWRGEARRLVDGVSCSWDHEVVDPMDRDFRGREHEPGIASEIVEGDKREIDRSDALLVYFDHPSVGTSMEILYAYERGKRIVIVNANGAKLSPWLVYHATVIVRTLDYGVRAALALARGPEPIE